MFLALLLLAQPISTCEVPPADALSVVIDAVESTRPVTIANSYQKIGLCDVPIAIVTDAGFHHTAVVKIPLSRIDHAPLDADTFASEIRSIGVPMPWSGKETTYSVEDGTLVVQVKDLSAPGAWVATEGVLEVRMKSGQLVLLNVGGPQLVLDRTALEQDNLDGRAKRLERDIVEAQAAIAEAKAKLADPSSVRSRYDDERDEYLKQAEQLAKEVKTGLADAKASFEAASQLDRLGALVHAEGVSAETSNALVLANNTMANARNNLKSDRELLEVLVESLGADDPEVARQREVIAAGERAVAKHEAAMHETEAKVLASLRQAGKLDALYARHDAFAGGTVSKKLSDAAYLKRMAADWQTYADSERAQALAYYREVVAAGPAKVSTLRTELAKVKATTPVPPYRVPTEHRIACPSS